MAIAFESEPTLGPDDPIALFYLRQPFDPSTPVSEMTPHGSSQALERPGGLETGVASYPGTAVPSEGQSPVEGRTNGNGHREHVTGGAVVSLAEELRKRGDPPIDYAAELAAMNAVADAYDESLRPGGANYPLPAPTFPESADRPIATNGDQIPPVINGKRISGEQWEILGPPK